jgi:hypothetical protein
MAFIVHGPNGPEDFGDNARYRFDDHSMLVVEPGDGRRLTYSPAAWLIVEDPEPGSRMHVLSGDH